MALGYAKLSYAVSRLGGEAVGTADLVADSGFGLRTLQKDDNCKGIYLPEIWGGQDFLWRRNLLTYTESSASWTKSATGTGVAPICTDNYGVAPDGSSTAIRVQLNKGGGSTSGDISTCKISCSSTTTGATYSHSVWIKALSVTQTIKLSDQSFTPANTTLTTEWEEYTFSLAAGDNGASIIFSTRGTYGTSDTADFLVWHPSKVLSTTTDQSYQKITDWTTEQYAWAAQKNVPWLRRNIWANTENYSAQANRTEVAISAQTYGFLETAATSAHSISGYVLTTVLAGSQAGFTVRVSGIGRPKCTVQFGTGASAVTDYWYGTLDFSTGSISGPGSYGLSAITYGSDTVSDGVWDVWMTCTCNTARDRFAYRIYGHDGSSGSYAGDITKGVNASRFHVQLLGAKPTYQPVDATWDATYTAAMIAAGYQGRLYQDSAGTTAVSSPDQVIGLEMDQSEGLVLGPELVTNGRVETGDLTGFASYGTPVSVAASAEQSKSGTYSIKVIADSVTDGVSQVAIPSVAGKSYMIEFWVYSSTGSCSLRWRNGNDTAWLYDSNIAVPINVWSLVRVHALETATGSSGGFRLASNAAGTFYFDNISVREIPGYHAIQATTADKPKLQLDSNGKWRIYYGDTTDKLTTTFPNYGANCVHYRADDLITLKDSSLTISGATNFGGSVGYDYGRIIMAAESANDAKIMKYLDSKAGRSAPRALGPELVTNGVLSADTDWTKGTGWTIANGVATHAGGTASYLTQAVGTAGKVYLVDFNVVAVVGNDTAIVYLGSSPSIATYSTPGRYSVIGTMQAGGLGISIRGSSSTGGSSVTVDNISVREVLA